MSTSDWLLLISLIVTAIGIPCVIAAFKVVRASGSQTAETKALEQRVERIEETQDIMLIAVLTSPGRARLERARREREKAAERAYVDRITGADT